MHSKNTLHLFESRHQKLKKRTQIFTNTYLATLANHKSNYTASFTLEKPESFTASTYAKIASL